MTDSPTSQAMHLAMTELKEREQRIAELEEALRRICKHFPTDTDMDAAGWDIAEINASCEAYDHARSVLNKETNRAALQQVGWVLQTTYGPLFEVNVTEEQKARFVPVYVADGVKTPLENDRA